MPRIFILVAVCPLTSAATIVSRAEAATAAIAVTAAASVSTAAAATTAEERTRDSPRLDQARCSTFFGLGTTTLPPSKAPYAAYEKAAGAQARESG